MPLILVILLWTVGSALLPLFACMIMGISNSPSNPFELLYIHKGMSLGGILLCLLALPLTIIFNMFVSKPWKCFYDSATKLFSYKPFDKSK